MPFQWTQIKDTPTQSSAMTTNTLHSFLSPQSPSEWDVILTAVLLSIQNFWDVTLLLSDWFPMILQKLAKTGHGPHSSTLFVILVVRLLFLLFCVLFVCECVLPPGDNPIAVNKYIILLKCRHVMSQSHRVTHRNTWILKFPPCPFPSCTKQFKGAHKV
jgi:hypothetical protein